MRATHSVAKNTMLLTIGLLTGRLLALFVIKKMAPILGPTGVGIWGFANDLTVILLVITNFGLGTLLTREITKARGMTLPIFWAALRIRWTLGLLCYLFLLAYLYGTGYASLTRAAVLVTGLALFVEATSMACDAVLQAHEKVQYQALGQLVSAVVYFVLAFWWLDAGYGVMGVIWANLISRIVRLLVMAPLMFYKTGPWCWAIPVGTRAPDVRWMLGLGFPLLLSTTFGIVAYKVDTVMLNHLLGEVVTGIYVLGHRALDYLLYIPVIFATALFPALAKYGLQSHGDARRIGERALRYMLVVMLPLTFFVMAVATPVIRWFDPSPRFADSIPVLQIVIWGVPFQAVNTILNRLLFAAEKERTFIIIGLVTMVMNVTLNLFLIPRYSYFGAAVATVISLAVSFVFHLGYVMRTPLRPPLLRTFGGPLLAVGTTWLAVRMLAHLLGTGSDAGALLLPIDRGWAPFLIVSGASATCYVAALLAGRVIRREDLKLLAQLWRQPLPPQDR